MQNESAIYEYLPTSQNGNTVGNPSSTSASVYLGHQKIRCSWHEMLQSGLITPMTKKKVTEQIKC